MGHLLSMVSDVASVMCALPLFTAGIQGKCVRNGFLGPMLTMVFAMSLVDDSALAAYLVYASPRPLSPGANSYMDVVEAVMGAWEFSIVSSVALQTTMLVSFWRVYRVLRLGGLYPPGTSGDKIPEVSVLEVMCEAEDIALIRTCECVSAAGGIVEDVQPPDAAQAA